MAGVVASVHLPFGAISRPFSLQRIAALSPSHRKMSVRLDEKGLLVGEEEERLVQSMTLSEDFHSCGAVLERSPGSSTSVVLRLTRSISQDREITLWFSQDLQAALDIPFLNPANIQGEKSYVCHRCRKSYEYPNPLKLHLALNCGRLKTSDLWTRLRDTLSVNNNRQVEQSCEKLFNLRLTANFGICPKRRSEFGNPPSPCLSSYSNPSPERPAHEDTRSSSEPPRYSAFRPYLLSSKEDNHPVVSTDMLNNRLSDTESVPKANRHGQQFLTDKLYLRHPAAEIETLVSNMGQSKQGHLCLYCGKIYSRKYGLKIHIRTHTGFKPLKCKYCLRPFGDPSNLNKHVRLHAESDTPYRCELCSKMLVRRRDLERHMKSRHNLINFS